MTFIPCLFSRAFMRTHTKLLPCLTVMIITAGLSATDGTLSEERGARAKQEALSRRGDLGIDENHDFRIRKTRIDEWGAIHAFMHQTETS